MKMLPKTYVSLGIRITICGDREVVENLKMVETGDTNMIQVVAMSTGANSFIKKYLQVFREREDWLLGESWCNELFQFMKGYMVNSGEVIW